MYTKSIKPPITYTCWRLAAVIAALMVCIALWGCGGHTRAGVRGSPDTPIDNASAPTASEGLSDYMGIYIPADYAWTPAYFDFDVWSRFRSEDDMLAVLYHGQVLEQLGGRVTITGHCDERGTIAYNLALGLKRAQYARQVLTSYGVDPKTIEVRSMGEEQPVDLGHNEKAWARNRRVEFQPGG